VAAGGLGRAFCGARLGFAMLRGGASRVATSVEGPSGPLFAFSLEGADTGTSVRLVSMASSFGGGGAALRASSGLPLPDCAAPGLAGDRTTAANPSATINPPPSKPSASLPNGDRVEGA
jgi:hypothetical protein